MRQIVPPNSGGGMVAHPTTGTKPDMKLSLHPALEHTGCCHTAPAASLSDSIPSPLKAIGGGLPKHGRLENNLWPNLLEPFVFRQFHLQ
jgi:hypothetical protein